MRKAGLPSMNANPSTGFPYTRMVFIPDGFGSSGFSSILLSSQEREDRVMLTANNTVRCSLHSGVRGFLQKSKASVVSRLFAAGCIALLVAVGAAAQSPVESVGAPAQDQVESAGSPAQAQVESRADQLEVVRKDKVARLWPESQSPIVNIANNMTERGLLSGGERSTFSGNLQGANGFQPVIFGGTRSGNGFSYGVGYQRRDLWRDRIGIRITARATTRKAFAFDFAAELPRALGRRGFLRYYTKYENSPRMDYYGPGPNSNEADRSSYLLEDTDVRFSAGYQFTRKFAAAADIGGYFVNVGPGHRSGVPSTQDVFTGAEAPGVNRQTNYFRWGGTARFDYRDDLIRPTHGGNYSARFTHYSDRSFRENGFMRLVGAAEQYLSYHNGGRVVAMRLEGQMAFVNRENGQEVPFYLQPTLGGNSRLRGFNNYRFTDATSILAVAEHRWYVAQPIDLAIFGETGKVAPLNTQLNFEDLKWSAGLSVRLHLFKTFFMRWDHAFSTEGYRMIFSFSDVFGREDRW
jgi:Omp85 superfamily domain